MTRRQLSGCLGLALALVPMTIAMPTHAEPANGFLSDLVLEIRAALSDASKSREPTPPVPVALEWRTANRGSFEVDSPLLALETAEMNGKTGEELVALTTTELIVFGLVPKPKVVARIALPNAPATLRSRDPVGTIAVDVSSGLARVSVRTSEHARGAVFGYVAGALALIEELPEAAGFPLCPGVSAKLVPGRNSFDPKSLKTEPGRWPSKLARPEKPFYRLECRELIGSDGHRNSVVALTGVEREVRVGCLGTMAADCSPGAIPTRPVDSAGVALEVADLNRDGVAEVSSALGKAPGSGDRLRVHGASGKQLKSKSIDPGIVAIAAADVAGDGRRVLYFAVKQPRAINLWTLNRHR